MQKALLFFLAVIALSVVVYSHSPSKEGFQNLMGVNWTSMNEGTPKALYTDLPIQQPKTVEIAEAGVGNIQPSPPPPASLPSAPFGQRSKEVPNPYRDPSTEPAKYIRILGVKEDLQAFFGFEAPLLDQSSDPSVQIPLTRARADLGDLLDVQTVMERNPGLTSRINNQQLNDISGNLRYLRSMLRDLQASGAIKDTALTAKQVKEGFQSLPSEQRASLKELQEFQIKVTLEIEKMQLIKSMTPQDEVRLTTLTRIQQDVDQVINQLMTGFMAPNQVPIYSLDIQNAGAFLGKVPKSPVRTAKMPVTQSSELSSNKRATLKQLQEFQVRVVVEQQRLSASGTSDPVIIARLNVLSKIKGDIDQVIYQLQSGQITPETVPIYAVDLERAFPVLGKPNDPLPTLLRDNSLPESLSSLFPGGLSAKDTEQLLQSNNVLKGYMKKFFDGSSWSISYRYDNPKIEELRYKTADKTQRLVEQLSKLGLPSDQGGLPGVVPGLTPSVQATDALATMNSPKTSDSRTQQGYDSGLPGTSTSRTLATPQAPFDWKQRNSEIVQQIRRRGMDPLLFGALPPDAQVSNDFSWRGHTQMMCMRLNATTDPGLAVSVGCPPQRWAGWKS